MNFYQFLLVLKARRGVVFALVFATVVVAVALSLLLPSRFTATADVVVDVKSPDPIIGMMLPGMTIPGYMATQVDIINSERVAQQVVQLLKLDQNPEAKRQWLEDTGGKGTLQSSIASSLQRGLQVKPSRESNVVSISFTSVDPASAAAVANAFADAYIDTNLELKVEPAKLYATWFESQGKLLRQNLEKAQQRLSDFQQEHGIVATDERLDNEVTTLNSLSMQLAVIEGQTTEALTKQRAGGASATLPEVMQNPLLQGLRADIVRQEAKLQEMAVSVGRNHPQYRRAESEVAALNQRLAEETRRVTGGFSTSRSVGRANQAELRAAIERQKQRLLDIKRKRDQLAVLTRDVEAAQKAYDTVSQRFNQVNLESQSTQTNVSVLTRAVEPTTPSFPNMRLNILIAIILGTALGMISALVLELLDRRVRSVNDLEEMLAFPVLGVLPYAKAPRRLLFWRAGALPSPE